jgi:hypothetical protein
MRVEGDYHIGCFQTSLVFFVNKSNKGSEKFRRFIQKKSLNREISELKGKGHEPSRAENSSARATAQASSARAHH